MTLGFSIKIKGKPTYFVEKIWRGLNLGIGGYQVEFEKRRDWLIKLNKLKHVSKNADISKIHTIREDKRNRWKVGNDIHFVINNRTKNRFQFAPVLKVKSIQKIFIHVDKGLSSGLYRFVKIDNRQLSNQEIEDLAINDGFENIKDFFDWFNEDFEGKIIHWTNYTY